MMHRDGPERRDAGKGKNIRSDVIIGGEERMKWKAKKKIPTPRRGVSLFF
jgi:hypothetical protein